MNTDRLRRHIKAYLRKLKEDPIKFEEAFNERRERTAYYQRWSAERIHQMSEADLFEYISKLWAMLMWGNKQYVVDKLIADHGLSRVTTELAELVWGKPPVEARWDHFRVSIKGMGPAMMSEILCHSHPDDCMLWNRRAYVGLHYLGVKDLPRYDYQVTGKKYAELSEQGKEIEKEMRALGDTNANLLSVDYFIWDELQVKDSLSQIQEQSELVPEPEKLTPISAEFIHDEIRDKLAAIGQWLGFLCKTEVKVADGSKVDTVWEATIGNLGRVIYVFEVQTKGSIDSLILNLLKSLNNAAVQGVVAVSDATQLEKIRKHAAGVPNLRDKLKYWDYTEVQRVHEALAGVNEGINRLGLVPQGFLSRAEPV